MLIVTSRPRSDFLKSIHMESLLKLTIFFCKMYYLCASNAGKSPWRTEGIKSQGSRAVVSSEAPHGLWELNPSPFQEQ